MMELDELKKELNTKMSSDRQRSESDISALLKSNTVSVLHKLKKSLLLEITLSVVFALLCSYMIFFSGSWQYRVLFSVLGIIAFALITILFFLIGKINIAMDTFPVKQKLENLRDVIEEYIKRYLQFTLFLLPLCFAFGVWLTYNDPENVLKPLTTKTILLLTGIMILLGVIVFVFTRWYLQKLYGNYLEQLNILLSELEEE